MIYSLQSNIETCMTMEEVSAMTGGQLGDWKGSMDVEERIEGRMMI